MPIPLRFTLPDGGASRFIAPAILMAAGVGIMIWFPLKAPWLTGWQRLVPYAFGGLFVVGGALSIVREMRRNAAREADRRALEEHADAPWRVRPEWRSDELVAGASLDRSFLAFALVWNLLTWPLAFLLIRSETGPGGSGDGAVWLVALFPLIGLGMLGKVVYQALRARKFGRTVVTLDPMPLRLGRIARGRVRAKVARDALPEDGFLVKVSCYRQRVRYSRDSEGRRRRRIDRDLLWRDETRLRGEPTVDGTGVEVPFAFALPAERPPSTPLKLETRLLWEVSAEAELPGIDFRAAVEVPVFPAEPGTVPPESEERDALAGGTAPDGLPTPAALAARPGAAAALPDPTATWDFDEPLTDGIRMVEEPDLFELHFTAARKRKGAITMGVLGALLLFGGFPLMAASGAVGFIFVLMGGFLVYGSIQQGTNDTVLRVADGRVVVTHDGVGMPADVDFPAAQVEDVIVHVGTGSSDNARYAIALVARAGEGLEHLEEQAGTVMNVMSRFGVDEDHPAMEAMKKGAETPRIAVADDFTDKDEADWLALKIREAVEREGGR